MDNDSSRSLLRWLAALTVTGLVAVAVIVLFVWMVPPAAAREVQAACAGLRPTVVNPALGQLPVAAPDFTVVGHDGKQAKLSDYRGRVVLLNFWASWCGVCKAEKPALAAMAADMSSNDFVVLTLASDKNFGDAMAAVLGSLAPSAPPLPRDASDRVPMNAIKEAFDRSLPGGPPFNVLLDPPRGDDTIGPITQAWGIHAVPESALIDRKGNIRAYFVNKRDWQSPVAQTCLRAVIDGE